MSDIKALGRAVDAAENHLRYQLDGIRHASADRIVDEIGLLIDAKIALAAATTSGLKDALEGLVTACSGEVEDVFKGEIGSALRKARTILGKAPETDSSGD
jgi:hypothetical protein